jgi:hypothetical protein
MLGRTAPAQLLVLWQIEQSVGKPADTWLGVVVCSNVGRWHEAQFFDIPTNVPLIWHIEQESVACIPVRGNDVMVL